jgi:hypothetical protein
MNQEKLMRRGRLAELEKRYSELDIATSSDIALTRTLVDPYEEPVTNLKVDEIESVVARLLSCIREMKKIMTQIRKLKEDLGLL